MGDQYWPTVRVSVALDLPADIAQQLRFAARVYGVSVDKVIEKLLKELQHADL